MIWVKSPDWTSGFYGGTLWYLYEYFKTPDWEKVARRWTDGLEKEKTNKGTHDLGFMLYCPFGNGNRLKPNAKYADIIKEGSYSLISRYKPKVGLIRSWDFCPKGMDWRYPVIIDNMMNLEMLFWAFKATGDSLFYKISITHADNTLKNHFRENGSSFHVVDYDSSSGKVRWKGTHQGYANQSAWARGQAWGLYGYTVCYRETKRPAYLAQAEKIAKFYLNHRNLPADLIPYWDFNAPEIPDEPRDVAAAAVACSGLLELCNYVPGQPGKILFEKAEKMLKSMSTSLYLASPGTNQHFALMHATGNKPGESEIDVPLNYADYYFVEALLRYKSLKDNKKF